MRPEHELIADIKGLKAQNKNLRARIGFLRFQNKALKVEVSDLLEFLRRHGARYVRPSCFSADRGSLSDAGCGAHISGGEPSGETATS